MRAWICVLTLAIALPAAAQPVSTDAARVSRLLGAIWRPLPATNAAEAQAAFVTACAGAIEEMAALDLLLPEQLTPEALAPVRTPRGLVIIPTAEDPAIVFIFPNPQMSAIASGLGRFNIDPAGEGKLVLHDAAGRDTHVQLGSAGGKTLMRLRAPGQSEATLLVGCAPTLG